MPLTVTANLQDLTGTANVGWAVFTLCGVGGNIPLASTLMIVSPSVRAMANSGGAISQVILGNDAISPDGTSYMVDVFDSKGTCVWGAKYTLAGSGSVDLSTLTPLS